ncbi:hypothetical protein MRX96_032656 [Rhipicephalus microplus]
MPSWAARRPCLFALRLFPAVLSERGGGEGDAQKRNLSSSLVRVQRALRMYWHESPRWALGTFLSNDFVRNLSEGRFKKTSREIALCETVRVNPTCESKETSTTTLSGLMLPSVSQTVAISSYTLSATE